jgi:hypothetical protein
MLGAVMKVMWWDNPNLEVVFDPNARRAEAGEVLVGIGDPQATMPGIVLNHKGALVACDSISQYVTGADEDLFKIWKAALPRGTADIRRVILEDLSLDTCFALLAFGEHLDGNKQPEWCGPKFADYVTTYEMGGYPDIGPARESLAVLHSVLGHSYLDPGLSDHDGPAEPLSARAFGDGFQACMTFLHQTLQQTIRPEDPQFPLHLREYGRALGHYDYEYQQYQMVLQHGLICQLSLPVRHSTKRRTIDALILEEISPTGLIKTLARQDTQHSWTRKGFAFLAVYRRNQAMTGNDMTISIDPDTGLSLHDLWHELERIENERWQGLRPCGSPRNLVSYREKDSGGNFIETEAPVDGHSERRHRMQANAPDQPWYDDQGRFTLVAAPKGVEVDRRMAPGTKLQWREDVMAAVWRLYSPVPDDVRVEDRIDVHGKHLSVARWKSNANLSVVESPTFLAWLASCSSRRQISSPADLPSPASFEVLNVPGGRVVVHREGVSLFDDWTSEPLEVEALRRTITDVAAASRQYAAFLERRPLDRAVKRLHQTVQRQKFDPEDLRQWTDQILIDKPALLAVSTQSPGHVETVNQFNLRQALERQWGLSEQRQNALELLNHVDATMASTLSELKRRRDRALTALAAGIGTGLLFVNIAELLKDKFTMNTYEWGLKLNRQLVPVDVLAREAVLLEIWEWIVLAVMLIGSIFGFTLFWKWGSKLGGSE